MFTALLDTNVLLPSTCRGFLLSLAVEGIYRPMWSTEILAELEEHEEVKLMRVEGLPRSEASARSTLLIASMEAFPDASAVGWEPLVGTLDCRTHTTSTCWPPHRSAERAPS